MERSTTRSRGSPSTKRHSDPPRHPELGALENRIAFAVAEVSIVWVVGYEYSLAAAPAAGPLQQKLFAQSGGIGWLFLQVIDLIGNVKDCKSV